MFIDRDKVLADFRELFIKKLTKNQNSTLTKVFQMMEDFNFKCADYLEKHQHLAELITDGLRPQEIFAKTNKRYNYEEINMVSRIIKYNNPPSRPATRSTRKNVEITLKSMMKHASEIDNSIFKPDQILQYLGKYSETMEDYLAKYSDVAELIKQGLSHKEIAAKTTKSNSVIRKVSTIIKYGDPSLNPNPYLSKYANVVTELKNDKTQREVRDITNVSLDTVNIVAKILKLNYTEKHRDGVKKNTEIRKQKEKQDGIILDFIKDTYINWRKCNSEIIGVSIKKDFDKFKNFQKTIKLPTGFDSDQFKKINESYIKEIKSLKEREKRMENYKIRKQKKQIRLKEKIRLLQIEETNKRETKKIEISQKNKKKDLVKIKQLKNKKTTINKKEVERLKKELDLFLEAGINPFSPEWDCVPYKYYHTYYKTLPIEEYWNDDQNKMLAIRKRIPYMEKYAENNLKEFNQDLADSLLIHLDILKNRETHVIPD